ARPVRNRGRSNGGAAGWGRLQMQKGHGSKLDARQEALIAALLTARTYAAAAEKAGVSESTLYAWLRISEFKPAFRDGRRAILEAAVAELQRASGDAVSTLRKNLTCGMFAQENSAALAILDRAFRGMAILDFEERMEQVEQRLGIKADDRTEER